MVVFFEELLDGEVVGLEDEERFLALASNSLEEGVVVEEGNWEEEG